MDEATHQQMANACSLPISVAAALMPDAHVGYGLPIGGVLATRGAVIPYAVGVDIACRVMLSVFEQPPSDLDQFQNSFEKALEANTRFGMGARWSLPKSHAVLEEDWGCTSITRSVRDLAASQLGTSGSGNHFVEFGELELFQPLGELQVGRYLALVSHSGSRGAGSKVAAHYTEVAIKQHPELSSQCKHLAWLDMDTEGQEYWAAMELMGRYASANHHVIHQEITEYLGLDRLYHMENHHNFAWKEEYQGENVIVHRKGATPAHQGTIGYIPGTMADPGFLVEGKGCEASLHSSAHGAGRRMSRKQALRSLDSATVRAALADKKVHVVSYGLDEAPSAYKDIRSVMEAQQELVRPLAQFTPRIVKMAPPGERPED